MSIAYKDGYRYQLQDAVTLDTAILPPAAIETPFLALDPEGRLTIRAGYAWDGPSGPAFHTATILRATLVHDALCQLIGDLKRLSPDHQRAVDRLFFALCREDGMNRFRATYVYLTVRLFRGLVARINPTNPVRFAP